MYTKNLTTEISSLEWRDAQLAAVSAQLEQAFPELKERLTSVAAKAGGIALLLTSRSIKKATATTIENWGAAQRNIAFERAKVASSNRSKVVHKPIYLKSNVREQLTRVLQMVVGLGLLGAALVALYHAPSSTLIEPFWGEPKRNWKKLAALAIGIVIAVIAGLRILKKARIRAQERLALRMHHEAAKQVFGIGQKVGEPCILSDIQAEVIQAGQSKIAGIAG